MPGNTSDPRRSDMSVILLYRRLGKTIENDKRNAEKFLKMTESDVFSATKMFERIISLNNQNRMHTKKFYPKNQFDIADQETRECYTKHRKIPQRLLVV